MSHGAHAIRLTAIKLLSSCCHFTACKLVTTCFQILSKKRFASPSGCQIAARSRRLSRHLDYFAKNTEGTFYFLESVLSMGNTQFGTHLYSQLEIFESKKLLKIPWRP